ncbi:MAG: hypothetical protein ACRDEA_06435 [Microcystaceae cyanobacterium]
MGDFIRGDKSICLPIASEAKYRDIIFNAEVFRQFLNQTWMTHPEIFPPQIEAGYWFHDIIFSLKQQLPIRRIKLKENSQVYQLRPDFVMPYMIGKTDEIDKALYLCQFGIPFEALAYVFGRNPMYWYRAYVSLGRASLVGTTVKDPKRLPAHLVADEKHTWLSGKRVFIPTTAAQGCILGVSLTQSASVEALTDGYRDEREGSTPSRP